jgi:LacI family transcriptional regulator
LRNKKTGIIGIITSGLELEVGVKKLSALQIELMSNGYGTMFGITSHNAEIENKLTLEYSRLCDGIIFLFDPQPECLNIVEKENKPYVVSDSYMKTAHAVSIDREVGIYNAISEQYQNYKNLIFITNQQMRDGDARVVAFKNGSESVGAHNYKMLYTKALGFSGGLAMTDIVMAEKNSLIICYNDRIAAGLLKGLTDAEANVPDDYGIVGFDNDNFTEYTHKSISTVTQSVDELAVKTVELLKLQIDGGKIKKISSIQTKFVSRETTK